MPRKSRIDAPGAMHHIIVRGIDRQKIFKDDETGIIWEVRELGITMISIARRLDQSVTAVGKTVIRGEKLAKAKK